MQLQIKKTLSNRSDRVKCVDFHPSEPWLLVSLYNGQCHIWNYELQTLLKTFEVCDQPSRCGKFIARKSWFVVGSDDMNLRVFNYNTHEKVAAFEAHSDYIRSVAVHPNQPLLLSSADDMVIKMWNWDQKFKCVMTFEGHSHYVMSVCFNPKDSNTFASASLDKTIKVWNLASPHPNYTLEGHEKGVNWVDYYNGGEKPYLISAADDKTVKIWDYQTKTCITTLEGHTQNVCAACFHPDLPVILSGSEDGTVRVWHATTYRLQNTLNYGFERVWSIAYHKGSNAVAIGYDEGSVVINLGREDPSVSMDNSGKIVYSKQNEIMMAHLQGADLGTVKDGERVSVAVKDLGNSEVYPQTLQHSPNGRFAVVCGDGEFIIYTALSWRNKSFGSALEFVWSSDSNEYACKESGTKIKLFKAFKERLVLSTPFNADSIYGGMLLGVKGGSFMCFYDWSTGSMVRRIDVVPTNVYWSENGEFVCISCADSYYILKYRSDVVASMVADGNVPQDGIEEAFDVVAETAEVVKNGCWAGDCFIYTTASNKLNYFVGGQVNSVAHFDKNMHLLGYLAKESRIVVCDKDVNIFTYSLSLTLLEYQIAVLRKDFATAQKLLINLTNEQRNKIARFLEGLGMKQLAMEVTTDVEHQFELSLQLQLLDQAYQIARAINQDIKWKQVGDFALQQWNIKVAEECFSNAKDYSSLFLIYNSLGEVEKMKTLAGQIGSGSLQNTSNLAFLSCFLSSNFEQCLELLNQAERYPEAALFARTYQQDGVTELYDQWVKQLRRDGMKKVADALQLPKGLAQSNGHHKQPSTQQPKQLQQQQQWQQQASPISVSPKRQDSPLKQKPSQPTTVAPVEPQQPKFDENLVPVVDTPSPVKQEQDQFRVQQPQVQPQPMMGRTSSVSPQLQQKMSSPSSSSSPGQQQKSQQQSSPVVSQQKDTRSPKLDFTNQPQQFVDQNAYQSQFKQPPVQQPPVMEFNQQPGGNQSPENDLFVDAVMPVQSNSPQKQQQFQDYNYDNNNVVNAAQEPQASLLDDDLDAVLAEGAGNIDLNEFSAANEPHSTGDAELDEFLNM
ncbi:hypothetical protein MIR68_005009 [Amoeboaphelidium protococcarum]|nr:hypothetical protein MIR68_005009 [Amoeboaphelidium protococcarum]